MAVQPAAPKIPANFNNFKLTKKWVYPNAFSNFPRAYIYEDDVYKSVILATQDRIIRYDINTGDVLWRSPILKPITEIANIGRCWDNGDPVIAAVSVQNNTLDVFFIGIHNGKIEARYNYKSPHVTEIRSVFVTDFDGDNHCEIYQGSVYASEYPIVEFNPDRTLNSHVVNFNRLIVGPPLRASVSGTPHLVFALSSDAVHPSGIALLPLSNLSATPNIYNISGLYGPPIIAVIKVSSTHDAIALSPVAKPSPFLLYVINLAPLSHTLIHSLPVTGEIVGASLSLGTPDLNADGIGDILVTFKDSAGTLYTGLYATNGSPTWAQVIPDADMSNAALNRLCPDHVVMEFIRVHGSAPYYLLWPGRPGLLFFCADTRRGAYHLSGSSLIQVMPFNANEYIDVLHDYATPTQSASLFPIRVSGQTNPVIALTKVISTGKQAVIYEIGYHGSFVFTQTKTITINHHLAAFSGRYHTLIDGNRVVDAITDEEWQHYEKTLAYNAPIYAVNSLYNRVISDAFVLHPFGFISVTHANLLNSPQKYYYHIGGQPYFSISDLNADGRLEYLATEHNPHHSGLSLLHLVNLSPTSSSLLIYPYSSTYGLNVIPLAHIKGNRLVVGFPNAYSNFTLSPDALNMFAFSSSGSLLWRSRIGANTILYSPLHDWSGDGIPDLIRIGLPHPYFAVLNGLTGSDIFTSGHPNVLFSYNTDFIVDPYPGANKNRIIQVYRRDAPTVSAIDFNIANIQTAFTATVSRYDHDIRNYDLAVGDLFFNSAAGHLGEIIVPSEFGFILYRIDQDSSPEGIRIVRDIAFDIGYALLIENGYCIYSYPERPNIIRRSDADHIRQIPGCAAIGGFRPVVQSVIISTTNNNKIIVSAGANGLIYVFRVNATIPKTIDLLYSYPLFSALARIAIADLDRDGIAEIYALTQNGDLFGLHFVDRFDYPSPRNFKDGIGLSDIDIQSSRLCYQASWQRPLTSKSISHYNLMLRDAYGAPMLNQYKMITDTFATSYEVEICYPDILGYLINDERYFAEVIAVYTDGKGSEPVFSDGVTIKSAPALQNSTFSATPLHQIVGRGVKWTLTLSNTGTSPVTTFVQIPIPSYLSLLGISATGGSIVMPPGGIAWLGIPLETNQQQILVFTATTNTATSVNIDALIVSENNSVPEFELNASANFIIPNLSSSVKTVTPTTTLIGSPVTFTIVLSNHIGITTFVRITDVIPPTMLLNTINAEAGISYLFSSGTLTATAEVPPHSRRVMTLNATITSGHGILTNCADIDDGHQVTQRCAYLNVLSPLNSVQLIKQSIPSQVNVNDVYSYVITIKNNSGFNVPGITISDVAPSSITFLSATGGLNILSNSATWTGHLSPNQVISFVITAKAPGTPTEVFNYITATHIGSSTALNAFAHTIIKGNYGLILHKEAKISTSAITYFIRITNTGLITSPVLVLRSPLATHAHYLPGQHAASKDILSYQFSTKELIWTGQIIPSETVYITWTMGITNSPHIMHYHNALLYSGSTLVAQAPSIHSNINNSHYALIKAKVLALDTHTVITGVPVSMISPAQTRITDEDGWAEFYVEFLDENEKKSALIYISYLTDEYIVVDRPHILLDEIRSGHVYELLFYALSTSTSYGIIRGTAFADLNADGYYNPPVDTPLIGHTIWGNQIYTTNLYGGYILTAPVSTTVIISSPIPSGFGWPTTQNPISFTINSSNSNTHHFGFATCQGLIHCTTPPSGFKWIYGFVYADQDGQINPGEWIYDATTDMPLSRIITVTDPIGNIITTTSGNDGYYALLLPLSHGNYFTIMVNLSGPEQTLIPMPMPLWLSDHSHGIRLDIPIFHSCPSGYSAIGGIVYSDTLNNGVFVYGFDKPLPLSVLVTTSNGLQNRTNFAYHFGCLPHGVYTVSSQTPHGFSATTPESVVLTAVQPSHSVYFGKALSGLPTPNPPYPYISRLSPINWQNVPSGSLNLSWIMTASHGTFIHHTRLCYRNICQHSSPHTLSAIRTIGGGELVTWTIRLCSDLGCIYYTDAEGGEPWHIQGIDPRKVLTLSAVIQQPFVRYNTTAPITIHIDYPFSTAIPVQVWYRPQNVSMLYPPIGNWKNTPTIIITGSTYISDQIQVPSLLLTHPNGYPLRLIMQLTYYDLMGYAHDIDNVWFSLPTEAKPWLAYLPLICHTCEYHDQYEPDNNFSQASTLAMDTVKTKNLVLYAGSHKDWTKFVLTRPISSTPVTYTYSISMFTEAPTLITLRCHQGCRERVYLYEWASSAIDREVMFNIHISSQSYIDLNSIWTIEAIPYGGYQAPSQYRMRLTWAVHNGIMNSIMNVNSQNGKVIEVKVHDR
ncbi:MAG: DUF11 domain-containing protein [Methylacidiphilales bacterium]|nr:DUF11 domain-containing protein [Candidatus Methylacidiphilales bacterium]